MTRLTSLDERLTANIDLVVAVGLVVTSAVSSVLTPTAAAWFPLALPLLFVLPGYVTMEMAYARRDGDRRPARPTDRPAIRMLERLALSLGLSLAVLPVLALLAYFSPWSLTDGTLLTVVSAYVIAMATAAAVVRLRHSADSKRRATGWGLDVPSPSDLSVPQLLINGALAVSVVLATATLGMGLIAPSREAGTTDLHLLTESGDRFVAEEYPDTLEAGETAQLTVGVTNDEREPVEYTVVAELQRVQIEGQSVNVVDNSGVGRVSFGLTQGETWRRQLAFNGSLTDRNLRLAVYLYRGDAPGSPSMETAYRSTYLWLDVRPSGDAD